MTGPYDQEIDELDNLMTVAGVPDWVTDEQGRHYRRRDRIMELIEAVADAAWQAGIAEADDA